MQKIDKGYMNDNYTDGKIFLKDMKPVAIAYLNYDNVVAGLKNLFLLKDATNVLPILSLENQNNKIISTFAYLKDERNILPNDLKKYFPQLLNGLEELHHVPISTAKKFAPAEKAKYFFAHIKKPLNDYAMYLDEVVSFFKKSDEREMVLCHNDLNVNNFIISQDQFMIVDFDTIGVNTKIFDYVSVITESLTLYDNDEDARSWINLLIKKNLIKKEDYEYVNEMNKMQNFLWSLWANYFFEIEKAPIYQELSEKLFAKFLEDKKLI